MHPLLAAARIGAWSYGGAILTFVLPMFLFIFVAGGLWVAYTMPHLNPGDPREPEGDADDRPANEPKDT